MLEKYYNIHDIVKFKIVSKSFFKWKFDNIFGAFENFETTKIEHVDFIVYLGKFEPSNQDCYILEGNYYVKDDYFYCKKDSYKFTKWEFEISGFENGNTIARISSNFLGYMWMSGFIIEFLIHFKMNEKNYPIVHASCVSDDVRGYLFSGRGGCGKTTIALNFLERGYKMLGDNFVILHDGKILSYFSPLNIFTYNLAPIIHKNLNIKMKLISNFKELLYKLTFNYIKIFTKINPKEIFHDLIVDSVKLNAIFILVPREKLEVEKIDKNELLDHLLMNQELDTLLFLQYISEYSYIFPKSKLSSHWSRYKKNLERNIPDNINIFKIEVPQKYSYNIFNEIIDVIENEKRSNTKI